MNGIVKAFPLALRMIFRDPINLFLAIVPTLIALALYLGTIFIVYSNFDFYVGLFKDWIYTADQATLLAKILTAVLIIFVFFLMSWTFVILVGIIAAPFNSMLSERIEMKLVQHRQLANKDQTLKEMVQDLGQTFKNELKKLIMIALVGGVAFLLNLFPLFYPVGIFLVALLLAVQFVDYSWSRHNLNFGACLKDMLKNLLPYSIPGFFFLLLVTIPIINAIIPALATSYFTVLWLYRQNKIQ